MSKQTFVIVGASLTGWPSGSRTNGSLTGMNVNVWDVTDQVQALIGSRLQVDRERLADPSAPLIELALERQVSDAER